MIDRERRKKLALHLRHLSIGLISNDEFESNIMDDVTNGSLLEQYRRAKQSKSDDAVITPMLEMCWQLYSDHKNYKLKGKYELQKESLEIIARCILFLHADIEYDWPRFEGSRLTTMDIILSLLTFGRYYHKKMSEFEVEFKQYQKLGDYEYWPFFKEDNYLSQLSKPPFLAV